MKKAKYMIYGTAGCAALSLLLALGTRAGAWPDEKSTEQSARTGDEQAIRKLTTDFAAALGKGDAKEVADLFTDQGEYISDDGTSIRGKPAIEKAYAAFLEKTKHPKVELSIDSVRFLSNGSATAEGVARVIGRPGQSPASDFTSLFVQESGQWRIAQLRESPDDTTNLRDIDWLIGSWTAKNGDTEVATTYAWDESKNYILMRYTIKERGKSLSGTQRIARDPRNDGLRSWIWGNDGDFGEGSWSWDGKRWLIEATGVDANGNELKALNVLTPLNNDAFTWQSTNRTSEGEELPDAAPVKVARVK